MIFCRIFLFFFLIQLLNATDVKLSWDSINFAKKYEVEIFRGEKVQVLEKIEGLEWKGSLPLGTFRYHVRAIDKLTRGGEWSDLQEFSIKAPLVVLSYPLDNVTLKSERKITFSWQPAVGIKKYKFEFQGETIETELTQLEVVVKQPGEQEWSVSPVVDADVPFNTSRAKLTFIDISRNWNSLSQLKGWFLGGHYEYTNDTGGVSNGKIATTKFIGFGVGADLWLGGKWGVSAGGQIRNMKVSNKTFSRLDADVLFKYSVLTAYTKKVYVIPSIGGGQRQLYEFRGSTAGLQSSKLNAFGALAKLELGVSLMKNWNFGIEGDYFKTLSLQGVPAGSKFSTSAPNFAYRLAALTEFGITPKWTVGGGVGFELAHFEYTNALAQKVTNESPSQYIILFGRFLFAN
jgi:hypothetical protein